MKAFVVIIDTQPTPFYNMSAQFVTILVYTLFHPNHIHAEGLVSFQMPPHKVSYHQLIWSRYDS